MGGNKPTEGGRENKDEQEAGVGVYLCLGGELFWPTGSWVGGGGLLVLDGGYRVQDLVSAASTSQTRVLLMSFQSFPFSEIPFCFPAPVTPGLATFAKQAFRNVDSFKRRWAVHGGCGSALPGMKELFKVFRIFTQLERGRLLLTYSRFPVNISIRSSVDATSMCTQ